MEERGEGQRQYQQQHDHDGGNLPRRRRCNPHNFTRKSAEAGGLAQSRDLLDIHPWHDVSPHEQLDRTQQ